MNYPLYDILDPLWSNEEPFFYSLDTPTSQFHGGWDALEDFQPKNEAFDEEIAPSPGSCSPVYVKSEWNPQEEFQCQQAQLQLLTQQHFLRRQQIQQTHQQLQQPQTLQHYLSQDLIASPSPKSKSSYLTLGVTHIPPVKSSLDSYHYNDASTSYDEPLKSMREFGFLSSHQFTNLDATCFGTQIETVKKLQSIPMDISGNLTDAQYHKIFKMYHLQLQLDSHPTMTEEDLEDIKAHGRMYFLKNVKTIVPKIGFKFHAHLSHRRCDERQYNIPGMAVTCKVREWIADDGLWRLYHFKKGKTVTAK